MIKSNYKRFSKGALSGLTLMLLMPFTASAQEGTTGMGSFTQEELMLGLALFLTVALVFAVICLVFVIFALRNILTGKMSAERTPEQQAAGAQDKKSSFWQQLNQKLTGAVPLEREAEVMTDHEYDGIRELDNSLPPWWVYMFYATIVFSVVYIGAYHFFGWGQLQDEEYQTELAEAHAEIEAYMAANGGAINENNVEYLSDEASLASGKTIYDANCAACHGTELQGTVGPNLADKYWLHGGSVGDIFKTIRDGVPAKGMISWKAQLSPEQIQHVSSYIISMEGSEPAGAKEPQGELYER